MSHPWAMVLVSLVGREASATQRQEKEVRRESAPSIGYRLLASWKR
jgi:hypothetical protein